MAADLTLQVRHELTAEQVAYSLAAAMCAGYDHRFQHLVRPGPAAIRALLRDYLADNGPANDWPGDDDEWDRQHRAIALAQRLGLDPFDLDGAR